MNIKFNYEEKNVMDNSFELGRKICGVQQLWTKKKKSGEQQLWTKKRKTWLDHERQGRRRTRWASSLTRKGKNEVNIKNETSLMTTIFKP